MNRRRFLRAIATAVVFFSPVFWIAAKQVEKVRSRFLRPPGALKEEDFKKQCIGCFKCATACPNDCIEMAGVEYGFSNIHTPVINPRSKGCTLCMRCTEVCPTGALKEISREKEIYSKETHMGTAILDEDLCYSYHGRTCGVCYRACPLQGTAMTIGLFEQPTVHVDACVGCGLCEQACVHMPQAIRIKPSGGEA